MEALIAKISIMLVPALLAVTLHEVAHGYVAERLGDPTARMLGRLTLNPLKHLDPIGTIALLIFGFGWARPVPVNFNNLRRPKQGMIWVALAGPLSNFVLALISAALLRGILGFSQGFSTEDEVVARVLQPLALMAGFSLYINVLLGVFNLMPLPPFDGGRVMVGLLPNRQGELLSRFEPFGFVLVILLIFYTPVWGAFFQPIISTLVVLFSGPALRIVQEAMQFLLQH